MTLPSISVIVCNYNDSRHLPECLEAILKQKCESLEVIVIDDGSTDDSVKIIERFAESFPQIRFIRNEKNLGVIASGNRGLQVAMGDYILWASANDYVLPTLFQKSLHLLAQFPDAAVCSACTWLVDENGANRRRLQTPIVSRTSRFIPPREARSFLRHQGRWFTSTTAFYKRTALLEVGGFDPELSWYADSFMQQLLALQYGACFIPERLAVERVSANSFSAESRVSIEAYLQMMQKGEQLMRTKMHKFFPDGYADDFRREARYGATMWLRREAEVQQQTYLQSLEGHLESRTLADDLFISVLRLFMRIQDLFVKLYMGLRLKHFTIHRLIAKIQGFSGNVMTRIRAKNFEIGSD